MNDRKEGRYYMNISELFELTFWVSNEIVRAKIPDKYRTLHNILMQNSQAGRPRQPFEIQKKDLIDALMGVPLFQLTKGQHQFLENLGIAKAVGKDGVETIQQVLCRDVVDVAASARKIEEVLTNINKGIRKSDQIKSGLQDCEFQERYEQDNEALMRMFLSGYASISNASDFKKWSNIWNEALMSMFLSGYVSRSNTSDFKKWSSIWYEIGCGIANGTWRQYIDPGLFMNLLVPEEKLAKR
jgi:hypothetical protein